MSLGACSLKTERASRKSSKDKLPWPSREKASPAKKWKIAVVQRPRYTPFGWVFFWHWIAELCLCSHSGLLLRTYSPAKGILTQLGHLLNAFAGHLNTGGLTFGHLARHQIRPQLTESLVNPVTKGNTRIKDCLRWPKLKIPWPVGNVLD